MIPRSCGQQRTNYCERSQNMKHTSLVQEQLSSVWENGQISPHCKEFILCILRKKKKILTRYKRTGHPTLCLTIFSALSFSCEFGPNATKRYVPPIAKTQPRKDRPCCSENKRIRKAGSLTVLSVASDLHVQKDKLCFLVNSSMGKTYLQILLTCISHAKTPGPRLSLLKNKIK